MSSPERESVTVLEECIDLQKRKSKDYQNPNSNIKQAMHYRRGVSTIHDMIQQKLYRAQSLLEPLENGDVSEPNFESLEDTYKDAINYLSFAVSYIRGKMEGQDITRDMLNRANNPFCIDLVHVKAEEHVLDTEYVPPVPSNQVHVDDVQENYTDSGAAELAAIKRTYHRSVAAVGPIRYPEGYNTKDDILKDSITETYERTRDIGDRMEEDESDHRNSIRSQGQ
jgi:hypothetical protein